MAILRLNNISKSYVQGRYKLNVLKDINLEVKQGEIVALVGSSGSGKSTLLQIIGLVDLPDSGNIYIDDQRCTHLSEEKLTLIRRTFLGYVYQFHHLLSDFSAIENVIMPLLIAGRSRSYAIAEAKEILAKLGLGERGNNLPSELSGGEQQRVAIARALISKPKLLLADEPTGNLDHKNGSLVMELILQEARQRNLSVIMVTHNLELAAMADRILALSDGFVSSGN